LVLNYFAGENCPQISFAPEEQDHMTNVAVSQHLIGTLLSYGSTGQFEPFLAKSWDQSDDGKIVQFKLREDIVAEDGTPLNSINFLNGLYAILKNEVKISIPTEFDLLIGWEDFHKGKTQNISGIEIKNEFEFKLNFSKKPLGLFKYLSLPKFGFVLLKDYNNGVWQDKQKVTSTGPYRILNYEINGDLVLIKRTEFPEILENSPDKVIVKRANNETFDQPHSINLYVQPKNLSTMTHGQKIFGPKYILSGIALSPKIGPFKSQEIRFKFQSLVRKYSQLLNQSEYPEVQFVNTFYKDEKLKNSIENKLTDYKSHSESFKNYELKVALPANFSTKERSNFENLISKVMSELGFKFKMIEIDRSQPNWLSKLSSYENYDVRIFSVATGGVFIPWAVKMMFCGKVGVGLPDINNSICKLVEEVEINKTDNTVAEAKLEQLISDEAQVIPYYYYGASWLVTEDIDIDNYSAITYYPRFDKLRLK
jgi:ABC-type oligopeptide transport system substrate-binding subunit